jgi:hypothetical protein
MIRKEGLPAVTRRPFRTAPLRRGISFQHSMQATGS